MPDVDTVVSLIRYEYEASNKHILCICFAIGLLIGTWIS